VRSKLDSIAVDATEMLGLRKTDYMRYGGPYKAFDSLIYPLMHLPEAQIRMEALARAKPKNSL
jgi:hypothetical protein